MCMQSVTYVAHMLVIRCQGIPGIPSTGRHSRTTLTTLTYQVDTGCLSTLTRATSDAILALRVLVQGRQHEWPAMLHTIPLTVQGPTRHQKSQASRLVGRKHVQLRHSRCCRLCYRNDTLLRQISVFKMCSECAVGSLQKTNAANQAALALGLIDIMDWP